MAKKTAITSDTMHMRSFLRSLPVRLTQQEVLERGEQLARTVTDLRVAEEVEKARKNEVKMTLDGKKLEVERLSEVVSKREEPRQVDCEERVSVVNGIAQIVRLDTGEVIETRSLSREELADLRQGRLPNVIEFPSREDISS